MKHPRLLPILLAAIIALGFASVSHADQTIIDDLIVSGSTCVGHDCVTDEEFGLAVVKLKENNLRIYFDDTSVSGSFPANDWEIIANGALSGSGNYLGFADRGVGSGDSGDGLCDGGIDDGMACNGACRGTCQGGPLNGSACVGDAQCAGSPCGDLGTCISPGGIIFRLEAGAPEDSLVVDSTGKVGVGLADPEVELHVVGELQVDGGIFLASSRERKRDIHELDEAAALEVMREIRPVRYRLRAKPEQETLGFIAEDVPDLVATRNRKTIDPVQIVAVLTRAVQAQQELIEQQREEAARLSARVEELEKHAGR